MASVELGLLPEHTEWRDEGCELFPSCLRCPLPRCVEEVARERQRLRMSARAKRMAELKTSGHTVNGIARLFVVSTRTVQRALAKSKAKNKKAKVQVKSEK